MNELDNKNVIEVPSIYGDMTYSYGDNKWWEEVGTKWHEVDDFRLVDLLSHVSKLITQRELGALEEYVIWCEDNCDGGYTRDLEDYLASRKDKE